MSVQITLTAEQVDGLRELLSLAERGREDFTELAAREAGDYEREDVERAEAAWAVAQGVAAAIAEQVDTAPRPRVTLAHNRSEAEGLVPACTECGAEAGERCLPHCTAPEVHPAQPTRRP